MLSRYLLLLERQLSCILPSGKHTKYIRKFTMFHDFHGQMDYFYDHFPVRKLQTFTRGYVPLSGL